MKQSSNILLKALEAFFRFLLRIPKNEPIIQDMEPKEIDTPVSPETPLPVQKYLWDTKANARHSVRVICDEEGLTVEQKNELCATVACESGFNPHAINRNMVAGKLSSTDYGICQINDYWHIGEGKSFISSNYVLQNPEECIRWMCKQWKAGRARMWVCWLRGMYQSYL